jgi:hypothetical protein
VDLMGASKIGICHIKKRPSFSACFTSLWSLAAGRRVGWCKPH